MEGKNTKLPIYKHNYKARRGAVETLVCVKTHIEAWDSAANFETADQMVSAIQHEAEMIGRYLDPVHQPIVLN